MNFFKATGDVAQGMMNMMNNNNWSAGNDKETKLRKDLGGCTYPDETKYLIEKSIKQVFHVYPFFSTDIIMFTENGFQKRYIEVKGILELDIKGKTCKVDYNMMIPTDFPRGAPNVRIINRNADYKVDPFYQKLQSKTDKSSFILNQKLNSVKNWHPSNSLVNVIMESNEVLKTRFPFAKPVESNNTYGGGNPWEKMYNKGAEGNNNNNNNFGGGGGGNKPVNNNWGHPGWNAANAATAATGATGGTVAANNNANWPQNNAWGKNMNVNQNQNQGTWGNANTGQVNTGGMGGMMGNNNSNNNVAGSIASGQKLVQKQKQTLGNLNNYYSNLIAKNQHLDLLKQSLDSEESTLRRENFEMANFLSTSEKGNITDLAKMVSPADERSEQVLDLIASVKAREDCLVFLEGRFNDEQINLDDFLKQLRKIEEARFEERVLLQKCVKNSN